MAESVVQNPFDPTGWTGRVELVEYDPVTIIAAESRLLVGPDPRRLWIVFACETFDNEFRVWMFQQNVTRGISPPEGQSHVLIHNASYPGAVQSSWFGRSNALAMNIYALAGRAIRTRDQGNVR